MTAELRDAALAALASAAAGEPVPGFAVYLGAAAGSIVTWSRVHGTGEVDEVKQATSFIAIAMLGGSASAPIARGRVARRRLAEFAREALSLDWSRATTTSSSDDLRIALSVGGRTVELAGSVDGVGLANFQRVAALARELAASATFEDPEATATSMPGSLRLPSGDPMLFEDERTITTDPKEFLEQFGAQGGGAAPAIEEEATGERTPLEPSPLEASVAAPPPPVPPPPPPRPRAISVLDFSDIDIEIEEIEIDESDLLPDEPDDEAEGQAQIEPGPRLTEDDLAVTRDAHPAFDPRAAVMFDDEATYAGDAGGLFATAESARQLATTLLHDVARSHLTLIEECIREQRDPHMAVAREIGEARRTYDRLVPATHRAEFDSVAERVLRNPREAPPPSRKR